MNIERATEVIRTHYDEYAEYGETYHGEEIIIADWNKVPDKLESYCYNEIEIGFSDEYIMDDNGKYHHNKGWTYIIWDCSVYPVDFFEKDNAVLIEYIQSELTDNPSNALHIPRLVDRLPEIADLISDDHENGLYPGMDDNPTDIMKLHKDYGHDTLFFALSAQTPFMVEFQLWQLKEDPAE